MSIKQEFSSSTPFFKDIQNYNYSVYIDIPEKCDFHCLFCVSSLRENKIKKYKFKLQESICSLKQVYPILKRKALCIGGREPLNYKYIIKLIQQAKEIGFECIALSTSSIRLANEQFVDLLVGAGVNQFYLSLYGHNSALHDFIVRQKGAFEIMLKIIDNLKKYRKVNIFLHTILIKQNYLFFT